MSTGALGKIQGGLDSLGNKAKGTGYFGIKDRQKEKKESSAWAMNKANRKAQRTKADATKQAGIVAGTSGSRIARRGAKFGLNEEQARIAAANAQQQLHKIEEEEKQARTILLKEEIKVRAEENHWDYGQISAELARMANSNDKTTRAAARSIIVSEQRTDALGSIDADSRREGELNDSAFQRFVYDKRRDLSDGGTAQHPHRPLNQMNVADLLTQSSEFWTGKDFNDFNQDELLALYQSPEFANAKVQAKRIIEQSINARAGMTYDPRGGATAPTRTTPSAPPTTRNMTPDGNYYTEDDIMIPDPSDPTRTIPNPNVRWKPTVRR